MKNIVMILIVGAAILSKGCASAGLTASSHITNVQLNNPNYKIVAVNVTGQSSSKALLGFSYGVGLASAQFALIPLTNDRKMYRNAISNLWTNFQSENGRAVNRKLALVNVRYDSESLNLFLYTKLTTVVVADVVEFE